MKGTSRDERAVAGCDGLPELLSHAGFGHSSCCSNFEWRIPSIHWTLARYSLRQKKPRVANMLVEDHLRPAAVKAGVLKEGAHSMSEDRLAAQDEMLAAMMTPSNAVN